MPVETMSKWGHNYRTWIGFLEYGDAILQLDDDSSMCSTLDLWKWFKLIGCPYNQMLLSTTLLRREIMTDWRWKGAVMGQSRTKQRMLEILQISLDIGTKWDHCNWSYSMHIAVSFTPNLVSKTDFV